MNRMKRQNGFTIIEIIIVIIILGLLAATALPRFLDTVDEAEDASLEGVAGAFATGVGLVRGLLAADALRAGRLQELTCAEIPAHYNLYAVWSHGQAERVAPLVEAIKQMAARTLLTAD